MDGIIDSKAYISKLVNFDLRLDDQVKTIEAFTFPVMNINLNLPGLSQIVDNFVSKGYQMADEQVIDSNDSIGNIELILGADAAYCFHDNSIHFGSQSVFNVTQLGVMLIGNINRLLSDIEYLPYLDDNNMQVASPITQTKNYVHVQLVNTLACAVGQ